MHPSHWKYLGKAKSAAAKDAVRTAGPQIEKATAVQDGHATWEAQQ